MTTEENDNVNEVYEALKDDMESPVPEGETKDDGDHSHEVTYEEFYKEVEQPYAPVSTPLDAKVRQAKRIMIQIEQELMHRLGDKQFVKVEFTKTYPKDVIDAVVKIYQDQEWYVSPRIYSKPYQDQRTGKKIYGNMFLNVHPMPINKIDEHDPMFIEDRDIEEK